MPLSPGTTLGPYEILSPIGAGGMGRWCTETSVRRGPGHRDAEGA